MQIRRLVLEDSGCFVKADVAFSSKTLLVGANNTGKTTLLRALVGLGALPVHQAADRRIAQPRASVEVYISGADIRGFLETQTNIAISHCPGEENSLTHVLAHGASYRWNVRGISDQHIRRIDATLPQGRVDGFTFYKGDGGQWHIRESRAITGEDSLANWLRGVFETRFVHLPATRQPQIQLPPRRGGELDSGGSNLVQLLHNLQSRPSAFGAYLEQVRTILPDIRHIQARSAAQDGFLEIRVSHHPDPDREDMFFSLAECGAGTAQVLALVYAATFSTASRILLVDEPSTNLHPGAFRELLRLFSREVQHQYILATHSLSAVGELQESSVLLLRRDDVGSVAVQAFTAEEIWNRRCLVEALGARLQDLLIAERVLWVEGATEKDIFEFIGARLGLPSRRMVILPLLATSELEHKDATRIAEIYRRLAIEDPLLGRTVGFVLDKETRTLKEQRELEKTLGNLVRFTPGGRMLENSFLDSGVVAQLFDDNVKLWKSNPVTADEIASFWDSLDLEPRRAAEPGRWCEEVDAAKVLARTVEHFTEARAAYDKRRHGLALASIAMERGSPHVAPLIEFVRQLAC